jgi:hypothetical protein
MRISLSSSHGYELTAARFGQPTWIGWKATVRVERRRA